ncbi:Bidirectional sugar transporter sweet14 [Thalictrum thalictroides]|uniref:Bidirectional sugar transporter SWEET n=1 Tax=Thalictrum thalictroides TaxID=46969 RepID=A0A7J6W1Y4_THATH|nr:Bidirectional sugar transporter sweet14 [Thalictrum thalictroides]
MAVISSHTHHLLALGFGILGNIVSFMVFLAPLPTFYRVYKKKNTEGFQSIPYVVALFSAMLWMYYALIKADGFLLLIINSVGCIIQSTYIIVYLIYAPKLAKIHTTKLLLLLNVVVYGLILLFTMLFSKGSKRVTIVGWICSGFAVCVFAAPLSIMKKVIRTKSVEFMPVSLSFFLTLCAIVWFLYGLLTMDLYVAAPNVLGFIFGVAQMILYYIYRHPRPDVVPELDLQPNGRQPQVKVTNQPVEPSESNV